MVVIVVGIASICGFASCAENPTGCPHSDANTVAAILDALGRKTSELRSYQCKVEYLFSQPVLESKTLRKGMLYYAKSGDHSKLRINFETLKQDEEPQQKHIEHYIFDGQWLTHIDYQIKQVQKRQLAEASAAGETSPKGGNEPIDAFELAKRNFPIIGFSKTDDLQQQFEVNLVGEPNQIIHLHLRVKPDSIYKDDYKSVEVWIDAKLNLPATISAVSTEGDIYEIRFVSAEVNGPIDEKVFEFTIPEGFGKPEIIPLKK
jgi:outer membrane lipoprotein-sorting protein